MTETDSRNLTTPVLCFVKVETSGLFRHDLPIHDSGQPFAMEMAAMLCTGDGAITSQFATLIRPDGRRPQDVAFKIHGISDRAAAQFGIPEPRALGLLGDLLKTPTVRGLKVISYTDFDPTIISSLFARYAVAQGKGPEAFVHLWAARPLIEFTTLQSPWCQQACKIAPETVGDEYRRPTIDEAAEMLIGTPQRAGLHDALSGLHRLRDLYFHFARAGAFESEAAA